MNRRTFRWRAVLCPARWTELLDYARWSPSPHNVQPWRLWVRSATEAQLCYNPARLLRHTDPTSCFTIIRLGMFLESLRVAAAPMIWQLEVAHAPEARLAYAATLPPSCLPACACGPAPALDRELLKQRRTARHAYTSCAASIKTFASHGAWYWPGSGPASSSTPTAPAHLRRPTSASSSATFRRRREVGMH